MMKKGRPYRGNVGLIRLAIAIVLLLIMALCAYIIGTFPARLRSRAPIKVEIAKTFVDMTVMSPYTAAEKFRDGQLPDSASSKKTACSINGYPDGLMLSRIHVMKPRAKASKIFCGILTTERDHKTNAPAVRDTWGKRCDGYLAFSTADDEEISAVKVHHVGADMRGENSWQRVRSLWQYVHAHFADEFDFFFLGRDDTFVIIENLRYYLTSPGIQERFNDHAGLYLGRRMKAEDYEGGDPGEFDGYYNHKDPGYVLDKHALKKLVSILDSQECHPDEDSEWDDTNLAACLYEAGEIRAISTADAHDRQRFHPFTPGMHLQYKIPEGKDFGGDWYPKEDPNIKEGYECCSTESVSFHYCHWDLMRQLYAYVYQCEDQNDSKSQTASLPIAN